MAAPSLTYTLTNGNTADASQVMQDLNDLLNGYSDGTKDLTISALIANGAVSFKGTVGLGDSTADDITHTGSLASDIPIKTTNAYDIGSTSIGLRALYFGANSHTTKIIGSGSMSADWTLTLPVSAGSNTNVLTTNGSGVAAWTAQTALALADSSSNAGIVNPYSAGTGVVYAARFTPTFTKGTNMSVSPSATSCMYIRVGKIVTVSGGCSVDTTASANTASDFTISLPITSTPTSFYDVQGCFTRLGVTGVAATVGYIGWASGSNASVYFNSNSASANATFCFQYEIK